MRQVGPMPPIIEAGIPIHEASVRAMTLPEGMSVPAAVLIALLVIALLAFLLRGVRIGPRDHDAAQVIAAVQAERDALRANHAVEIATLEGRLADAKSRLQREMDAALKLKEAERKLALVREEADRRAAEIAALNERLSLLGRNVDNATGRAAEVPQLIGERDRARSELASQSEIISDLRRQLQEAIARASRANAAREGHGETVAELTRERDRAIAEATRAANEVNELRRELQAMMTRLTQATANATRADEFATEIKALRQREEHLRTTVRDRESSIGELREALKARESGAEVAEIRRLMDQLSAAADREKSANDSLSRLAYERDGMRTRVAAAERIESQAKAEVEKREALLELRLQKIYALEAKLRDQHAMLAEAQRRAASAEETVAALRQGGELPPAPAPTPDSEMRAKVDALQTKVDEVRSENVALLDELEELRQKASTDGEAYGAVASLTAELDAARRELGALRQENARMKAAPPAAAPVDPAELDGARRQTAALQEELERLKNSGDAAASAELEAARRDVAALRRDNARLRSEAAAESGAAYSEIEALKARIRDLAERFMDGGDMPPERAGETLADRIRAFKASRAPNAGG